MFLLTVEVPSTNLRFIIDLCTVISLVLAVIFVYVWFSVGMKSPLSGNKLLGGSAKKSDVGVAPVELLGNKLSISDIRKRRMDEKETRAPLAALNTEDEPEIDSTDCTVGSPVETVVYNRKRHKSGTTPPTPPLRSSFRRREEKEVSLPPGFESCSPDMRIVTTAEASLPVPEQVADVDTEQPVNRELMSPSIIEDER